MAFMVLSESVVNTDTPEKAYVLTEPYLSASYSLETVLMQSASHCCVTLWSYRHKTYPNFFTHPSESEVLYITEDVPKKDPFFQGYTLGP